jgi:hypothetical protein
MIYTTEILLPVSTTFSGSAIIVGDAVRAASYYGNKVNGIQTATISTSGFVGILKLQGTLNDLAEQALWFDIDSIGDGINPLTDLVALNLIGNFVWVRAQIVAFSAGTINSATLTF